MPEQKQAPPPAGPAPDPNAQAFAAIDRLRDLAKWLILILGAIGGTLIAGSQLSDIGATEDLHLIAAGGGIALSLLGVGVAIWFTVEVISPSHISLPLLATKGDKSPVAKLAKKEPALLFNRATTIPELNAVRQLAIKAEEEAATAAEATPKSKNLKEQLEAARTKRQNIDADVNRLLGVARFAEVKADMRHALWAMFAGGLATAVGITVFAWATNQSEPAAEAAAAVPKRPTAVVVRLSSRGRQSLSEDLGSRCNPERVRAIALGGEPSVLDLIAVPTRRCAPIRFTLTPAFGRAESVEAVVVP